ncbi:MAG: L-ribulokinase [Haloplasmataceae bacterium]|jgi:L-ribulokinase|nr:L-ribulokinase [Haloplasmataceae bacterium]
MKKYTLGIDFGTLSGRILLVDVENGEEVACSIVNYKHGVMEEYLCNTNQRLPLDYALQHPQDYLDVLSIGVRKVMNEANINIDDIIGIGVDFTACTILPIDSDRNPLCFNDKFKNNPHAYVKLWKHHSAQEQATKIIKLAKKRNEKFLARYGYQISSEWLLPKILEIVEEDPEIYDNTDKFIEAGDWIVSLLVGKEVRSSCQAGYKGLWHKQDGYPDNEFFKMLHPKLDRFVNNKLSINILSIGECAGVLSEDSATLIGLKAGIPVAGAYIDAHSAVPAVGITEEGKMLMIMGTSTCHMVLSKREIFVTGISGVVEDGIIPEFYGYEAGQACVGNAFEWLVDNLVPKKYYDAAEKEGMSIYNYLNKKAALLKPGENGLLALDWLNGNRSILSNSELTGSIYGLNLLTKSEDIYRALIEATAFGTRVIIEQFESQGIKIDELYATGGISKKSPLIMQIYADVTGRTIKIGSSEQAVALGSAILGAVVATSKNGGYDSITDASLKMGNVDTVVYTPIESNRLVYNILYNEYKLLHDYLGNGENEVLLRLKSLRNKILRGE